MRIPLRYNAPGVVVSNLVSTVFGIPMAWISMVGLSLLTTGAGAHGFNTPLDVFKTVVFQASWLVPYGEYLEWMIPSATLVLLVPYFFVSVYSERLVLRLWWTEEPKKQINRYTWISNLITYLGFYAYTVCWLVVAVIPGWRCHHDN